jgi:hypothetical protein
MKINSAHEDKEELLKLSTTNLLYSLYSDTQLAPVNVKTLFKFVKEEIKFVHAKFEKTTDNPLSQHSQCN